MAAQPAAIFYAGVFTGAPSRQPRGEQLVQLAGNFGLDVDKSAADALVFPVETLDLAVQVETEAPALVRNDQAHPDPVADLEIAAIGRDLETFRVPVDQRITCAVEHERRPLFGKPRQSPPVLPGILRTAERRFEQSGCKPDQGLPNRLKIKLNHVPGGARSQQAGGE